MSRQQIQTVYDSMWARFSDAMQKGDYELDSWIHRPEEDSRRGITALSWLQPQSESLAREISGFMDVIREHEPQQYYHPSEELHLTVLSIISCVSGFELKNICSSHYADVFCESFRECGPVEIEYRGISASPSCIVIQGFPADHSLERLRSQLRRNFTRSGLHTTMDSRYKIITAHSSVIRFCRPLKNPARLLQLCSAYRNHHFGDICLSDFELVFNNWYQNRSCSREIISASAIP